MISAAAIWMQPFYSWHQFDDFQLFDFVVKPANFCLFQFHFSPFDRIGLRHGLDDLYDFRSRGHAFLFRL